MFDSDDCTVIEHWSLDMHLNPNKLPSEMDTSGRSRRKKVNHQLILNCFITIIPQSICLLYQNINMNVVFGFLLKKSFCISWYMSQNFWLVIICTFAQGNYYHVPQLCSNHNCESQIVTVLLHSQYECEASIISMAAKFKESLRPTKFTKLHILSAKTLYILCYSQAFSSELCS